MRALGIDIYQRWQPNYVPQKHHTFVTIKVAEGQYVVQHERVWEQAKPVPINIAYLYLRSGVPALAQAEALIDATKDASYQPDGYMIDFERTNNSPSVQFGQIFKETVHIVGEETGKFVQKYSNPSIIQSWLLQYGQDWVLDEPETWVIAQYPYNRWAWRTAAALQFLQDVKEDDLWNPRLPAGFKGWGWWQYSADGNNQGPLNGIGKYVLGIGPAVDLQVFDGTHEEMLAVFDLGEGPPDDDECKCQDQIDEIVAARQSDVKNIVENRLVIEAMTERVDALVVRHNLETIDIRGSITAMTEKYDEKVKSLSRRIRNNKNAIAATIADVTQIDKELENHTHETPEPEYTEVTANNAGGNRVNLRHDRNKNNPDPPKIPKPIWTIEEPRVQFENGEKIHITEAPVTGNGAEVAYPVVGPNGKGLGLFVLEEDFTR